MIIDVQKFPDCYQNYKWDKKHKLYGYPSDSYPDFLWIESLEKRFNWLLENSLALKTASIYLVQEMIDWGGSQNGVLQKFQNGIGEVNLYEIIQKTITVIDTPEKAIGIALTIPGFGLTYASKLLRFLDPTRYGALDRIIREKLLEIDLLAKIDLNKKYSKIEGYLMFLEILENLSTKLQSGNIKKPMCNLSSDGFWRIADIEMALFVWSKLK
jgi:hypothetical protein